MSHLATDAAREEDSSSEDDYYDDETGAEEEEDEEPEEEGCESEDDDDDDDLNAIPEYLTGPQDPTRMQLNEEERQWALSIKSAVRETDDLDELTDYMYAQIAIVDQGDMDQALDRIYRLQNFREEYDLPESLQHAERTLDRFAEALPRHLLHFFFNPNTETWSLLLDFNKVNLEVVTTVEGKKLFFQGGYYLHHACHLDLAAVRKGVFFVLECGGFQWRAPGLVDLNFFRAGMDEMVAVYPTHYYKKRFCNPGVFINMFWTMIRRITPPQIQEKFEVANNTEVRLDRVCLVPNAEAATARVLRDLKEALRRRFENEKTFRL